MSSVCAVAVQRKRLSIKRTHYEPWYYLFRELPGTEYIICAHNDRVRTERAPIALNDHFSRRLRSRIWVVGMQRIFFRRPVVEHFAIYFIGADMDESRHVLLTGGLQNDVGSQR